MQYKFERQYVWLVDHESAALLPSLKKETIFQMKSLAVSHPVDGAGLRMGVLRRWLGRYSGRLILICNPNWRLTNSFDPRKVGPLEARARSASNFIHMKNLTPLMSIIIPQFLELHGMSVRHILCLHKIIAYLLRITCWLSVIGLQ